MLRHLKPLGELPELHAAVCDRLIQIVLRDQTADGPFVGAVFVALAAVDCGAEAVEAAGFTVPQLMGQVDALLDAAVHDGLIHPDAAGPVLQQDGHGAVFFHGIPDHLYILLLCDLIEGQNVHGYSFFLLASRCLT